jgi:hypothetical protein
MRTGDRPDKDRDVAKVDATVAGEIARCTFGRKLCGMAEAPLKRCNVAEVDIAIVIAVSGDAGKLGCNAQRFARWARYEK